MRCFLRNEEDIYYETLGKRFGITIIAAMDSIF